MRDGSLPNSICKNVAFFLRCLFEWAGFVVLWLLFVFQINATELLAGALASALTVLAVETAFRSVPLCFQPRLRWLLQAVRLPASIGRDLWVLLKALARHLRGKPSRAAFQLASFNVSGSDSRAAAQRALAVLFLSIPPNSVVLDVKSRTPGLALPCTGAGSDAAACARIGEMMRICGQ